MIKARRTNKNPYPPTGQYVYPPPVANKFKALVIEPFKPFRLRPDGSKQSQAEANILMRIAAVVQKRGTPAEGGIVQ